MSEIQAMLDELRAKAGAGDADGVEDVIGQLEFFVMDEGKWPDELFEGVKGLLHDERFLAVNSSYRMAYLLTQNWDELSTDQQEQLRPVLAAAFDKFLDWMGAFIVAEIFGERYADEAAFQTLDGLSSTARTNPCRALAAYGLGRLARTLTSGPLYDRVVDRLNALAGSEVEAIREESSGALRRLGKTKP